MTLFMVAYAKHTFRFCDYLFTDGISQDSRQVLFFQKDRFIIHSVVRLLISPCTFCGVFRCPDHFPHYSSMQKPLLWHFAKGMSILTAKADIAMPLPHLLDYHNYRIKSLRRASSTGHGIMLRHRFSRLFVDTLITLRAFTRKNTRNATDTGAR